MNEMIPAILFLLLCVTTFIFSNYWLKKNDLKAKIHSVDTENKMNFEKWISIHIKNVKIGSIILIIITVLKIIQILLKN
ncbi:hypothetical protein [Flavobacterium sp. N1736]|uniref:hypothetical protein n=1 Tax=Flavobacterium sp. N1736 TaxID=2986823 RepID=UPI00222440F9|nr:hypothetical protein [Flavobacterium sp. N1736]